MGGARGEGRGEGDGGRGLRGVETGPVAPPPPPPPPSPRRHRALAQQPRSDPWSPRPRVSSRRPGSRKMTLKASGGEGGGSMRTALSDLYLEHLLQKRSRPEVSGPRGSPGRGVPSRESAAPPAGGPPLSAALAPGGPALGGGGSCLRGEGRGGKQRVRGVLGSMGGCCPGQPFWVGISRGQGLDRVLFKVKENFFVDGSQGNRKTWGADPRGLIRWC